MKSNYDEISPITHNLSVLVEQDDATGLTSKICMDSGYTTNSFLIDGSETLSKLESMLSNCIWGREWIFRLFWRLWLSEEE